MNGTRNHGLVLDGNQPLEQLYGYSDADWGGNVDDRKSKSGYCIFWNGALVSWKSTYQQSVALSTTEAEYVAACTTGRELAWLRKLLNELGYHQTMSKILEDNQGTIAISNSAIESEKSKHIDICYHWLRDQIKEKKLKMEYCPTSLMTADTLTKSLVKDKFIEHRNGLQVYDTMDVLINWPVVRGGVLEYSLQANYMASCLSTKTRDNSSPSTSTVTWNPKLVDYK